MITPISAVQSNVTTY